MVYQFYRRIGDCTMKHLMITTFAAGSLLAASTTFAATPDQVGTYTGKAKINNWDLDTGKKSTLQTSFSVLIQADNTMTFSDEIISRTSDSNQLGSARGGFHFDVDIIELHMTALFTISNGKLKGKYQIVVPDGSQDASFSLKKEP
jgi:hypothetical protein